MRLDELKIESGLSDSMYNKVLGLLKDRQDFSSLNKVTAMWDQGERAIFKYHNALASLGSAEIDSLLRKGTQE